MPDRLIVTNGDIAADRIREAGIEGELLPWRDAFHEGPAPPGLLLEALSIVRSTYLATAFGRSVLEIHRSFAQRDALIRNHGSYDRVELWFEHDLCDQLQLIQLLDFFAQEKREEGVFLLQSHDYLGSASAEAVLALAQTDRPVHAEQFAGAQKAWLAFTASNPSAMALQAQAAAIGLPYLPAAFRRLLAELPALGSGLSLTQERALQALAREPQRVGELFAAIQEQEEARFLGDESFFRQVEELAFAETPLVQGLPYRRRASEENGRVTGHSDYAASALAITDAGRAALEHRFDHAVENGIDRWLGGTHLTPKSLWRRDYAGGLAA